MVESLSVKEALAGPRDSVAIAQHVICGEITEVLLALFLDSYDRVIGYAEIIRGTLNATRFSARDLLVPSLHANVAAVIIAYNHPSGKAAPSCADWTMTFALRRLAELVGVPLLAH